MKKLSVFIALGIAAMLPASAMAGSSSTRTFTHEGVVYSYTSTSSAGHVVLEGTADGKFPFRFIVTQNRVRGHVDGKAVSFARPKKQSMESMTLAIR